MTPPDSVQFWSAVSLLGSPLAMTVTCITLAITLAARGKRSASAATLLLQGGGGLLNMAIKTVVRRPRPPGSELLLHGFSWSFPSGHAMGSLIGYGMLCYCVTRYWTPSQAVRRSVVALSSLLVLAVGVSRVALGVHYRGDVLGGYLIGAAWRTSGINVLRRIEAAELNRPPARAR